MSQDEQTPPLGRQWTKHDLNDDQNTAEDTAKDSVRAGEPGASQASWPQPPASWHAAAVHNGGQGVATGETDATQHQSEKPLKAEPVTSPERKPKAPNHATSPTHERVEKTANDFVATFMSDGNSSAAIIKMLDAKIAENAATRMSQNGADDQTMLDRWSSDDPDFKCIREAQMHGMQNNTAIYLRFNRDKSGGKSDTYKDMTFAERKKIKADYVAAKYTAAVKGKTETISWREVDEEWGTYHPLAIVIRDEGGKDDPEAVKAGVLYVEKCISMGGRWIQYNDMTERFEYLYVKKIWEKAFTKSWSMYTEFRDGGDQDPPAPKAKVKAEAPKNKRKAETDADKKKNPDGGATPAGSPDQEGKKYKKSLDKAVSDAVKTKNMYNEVIGKQSSIIKAIDANDEWSVYSVAAKNSVQEQMIIARKNLDSKVSEFAQEVFMLSETKVLRKKYKGPILQSNCMKMTEELDPLIDSLDGEVAHRQCTEPVTTSCFDSFYIVMLFVPQNKKKNPEYLFETKLG